MRDRAHSGHSIRMISKSQLHHNMMYVFLNIIGGAYNTINVSFAATQL